MLVVATQAAQCVTLPHSPPAPPLPFPSFVHSPLALGRSGFKVASLARFGAIGLAWYKRAARRGCSATSWRAVIRARLCRSPQGDEPDVGPSRSCGALHLVHLLRNTDIRGLQEGVFSPPDDSRLPRKPARPTLSTLCHRNPKHCNTSLSSSFWNNYQKILWQQADASLWLAPNPETAPQP